MLSFLPSVGHGKHRGVDASPPGGEHSVRSEQSKQLPTGRQNGKQAPEQQSKRQKGNAAVIFGSFNVYIEAPDNTIGDRIVLDTARLGAWIHRGLICMGDGAGVYGTPPPSQAKLLRRVTRAEPDVYSRRGTWFQYRGTHIRPRPAAIGRCSSHCWCRFRILLRLSPGF